MKINHVAMYVSNLEQSKNFYIKYFGAVPSNKYHNKKTGLQTYFLLFECNAKLEIMNRPDCAIGNHLDLITGLTHIAFSVGNKETVDSITLKIKSDGYYVVSEPRITGDGYYESVILDNDGNRIEITE